MRVLQEQGTESAAARSLLGAPGDDLVTPGFQEHIGGCPKTDVVIVRIRAGGDPTHDAPGSIQILDDDRGRVDLPSGGPTDQPKIRGSNDLGRRNDPTFGGNRIAL